MEIKEAAEKPEGNEEPGELSGSSSDSSSSDSESSSSSSSSDGSSSDSSSGSSSSSESEDNDDADVAHMPSCGNEQLRKLYMAKKSEKEQEAARKKAATEANRTGAAPDELPIPLSSASLDPAEFQKRAKALELLVTPKVIFFFFWYTLLISGFSQRFWGNRYFSILYVAIQHVHQGAAGAEGTTLE